MGKGNVLSKAGYSVSAYLAKNSGYYYSILTVTHPDKTQDPPKWKSTHLPIKNNERKAAKIVSQRQLEMLEDLIREANKKYLLVDTSTSIPEFFHRCIDYKEAQEKGAKYHIEANTAKNYRSSVNKHIAPYFTPERGILLENLTATDIEIFLDDRLQNGNIGANTVCHIYNLFSACLTLAAKKFRIIPYNFIGEVDKPTFDVKRFDYFSIDEMVQYMDFVLKDSVIMYIPTMLACFYGLRRSEVCGLKEDAIDLKNNILYIRRAMVEGKKGEGYILKDYGKSSASNRTYKLEPDVKKALIQHFDTLAIIRAVKGPKFNSDNYLNFWPDDGRFVTPNYITQAHKKAMDRCKLKNIRFHDLRHSCAAALTAKGFSLRMIADFMGHNDPKTTLIYAHLAVEIRQQMSSVLQTEITRASNGSPNTSGTNDANGITGLDIASIPDDELLSLVARAITSGQLSLVNKQHEAAPVPEYSMTTATVNSPLSII